MSGPYRPEDDGLDAARGALNGVAITAAIVIIVALAWTVLT